MHTCVLKFLGCYQMNISVSQYTQFTVTHFIELNLFKSYVC